MAKLWTSDDGGVEKTVEAFCFARDVELDAGLVKYDVLGSLAHAKMLHSIGVLDADELASLCAGLVKLERDYRKGQWSIAVEDEDVHTAIESRLVGLVL